MQTIKKKQAGHSKNKFPLNLINHRTLLVICAILLFIFISKLRQSDEEHNLDIKFSALAQAVSETQDGGYIAVCVIAKDEHINLLEWVTYHWTLGISKFYIEDDGSEPPMKDLLQPFIQSRVVVYHYADEPGRHNRQNLWFNECLDTYRHDHSWIGFIDPDEYVILQGKAKTLTTLLQDFEEQACVVIPWLLFGSSGHKYPPKEGVLAGYTKCEPINPEKPTVGKAFSNTQFVWRQDPHECLVTTQGRGVTTVDGQTVGEKGRIYLKNQPGAVLHHYVQKSWQEYEWKMQIGDLWPDRNRTTGRWNSIENLVTETCNEGVTLGSMTMHVMEMYGLLRHEGEFMKRYPRFGF